MKKKHTKQTSLSDCKMILLKITIPCEEYFSCNQVFFKKVNLTIVHYSILK